MRYIPLALALLFPPINPVLAQDALSEEDAARWEQPDNKVVREDDPLAPYISFFTPTYRDNGNPDLTWSMMATRWRADGEIAMSVGVRIVHVGKSPLSITGGRVAGARLAEETLLATDVLAPIETCKDGACRQYETASFSLPPEALVAGIPNDLKIRILTAGGDDPVIVFPKAIVADLYRQSGAASLKY